MAIFGWKKKENEAAPAASPQPDKPAAAGDGDGFSPEKARRFFVHAQTSGETGGYEYAMTMWLSGLRHDPGNMDAIKGFFAAAAGFRDQGNKAATKDIERAVAGKGGPLDKYLQTLLAWALKPMDAALAVRAAVAPAELNLLEPAKFIAPKALDVVYREAKPRKDQIVALMKVLAKTGQMDLAVSAGERLVRMDPTDAKLATDVKNLAAQASINKGGYENAGQAGGFRSNIRDADAQRKIEEAERLVKSEDVVERVVASTKADYLARPGDKPSLNKYVRALLERGTPADEQTAIEVLEKAFGETHEFGFRKTAGEIRIKSGRRELRALREAMEKNPGDAGAAAAFREREAAQIALEIAELEAQKAAYPTDLTVKFELGKRYFVAQRFEEAIGEFQVAKEDGRSRSSVLNFLGRSFAAIGWLDEAIATFREALANHQDPSDAAGLELRYGLLTSLQRHAEDHGDLAGAEEALKIAQAIAIQQINFKDIRQRRDAIKALVARLRPPAPGAAPASA